MTKIAEQLMTDSDSASDCTHQDNMIGIQIFR